MIAKRAVQIVMLTILLTACNSQSIEQQIHNQMEEAISLEETFAQQQDIITDLETKEQEIYKQIIELEGDESADINELSEQAIEIIEQRTEEIELEKESIDASQQEFREIESLIPELENDQVRGSAQVMYETMISRYNSYDKLYDAYTESSALEKELYTLLTQEDVDQDQITSQINAINESYQNVLEANEAFNRYTVEYNDLKKEFYELANIGVEPSVDGQE